MPRPTASFLWPRLPPTAATFKSQLCVCKTNVPVLPLPLHILMDDVNAGHSPKNFRSQFDNFQLLRFERIDIFHPRLAGFRGCPYHGECVSGCDDILDTCAKMGAPEKEIFHCPEHCFSSLPQKTRLC
uniref:Uncharacterized protein n=1 Tax=Lutzomyia longipalpis TaxID=7200 RepID=A0A1B0GGW1_LUTLO